MQATDYKKQNNSNKQSNKRSELLNWQAPDETKQQDDDWSLRVPKAQEDSLPPIDLQGCWKHKKTHYHRTISKGGMKYK